MFCIKRTTTWRGRGLDHDKPVLHTRKGARSRRDDSDEDTLLGGGLGQADDDNLMLASRRGATTWVSTGRPGERLRTEREAERDSCRGHNGVDN